MHPSSRRRWSSSHTNPMPTERLLSPIRLRECADHILVPHKLLNDSALRSEAIPFIQRFFQSHGDRGPACYTLQANRGAGWIRRTTHVCLHVHSLRSKILIFDRSCAIPYFIQAKFLHSKQIEKLFESGGKGSPVLDFEQRMERRIKEGKRGRSGRLLFRQRDASRDMRREWKGTNRRPAWSSS